MNTRRFVLAVVLACGLGWPPAVRAETLFAKPLPFGLDFGLTPSSRQVSKAKKLVTFDDLHLFQIKCSTIVGWHDAGHFLQLTNGKLFKVAAQTGQAEPVNDPSLLATSMETAAALSESDGEVAGPATAPQKGKGNSPQSPDGKWTAVVRGGNLFVVNKETKAEKKLTKDGSNLILNGRADWVYMEELYGRGNYQTFWWSPNSKHIAFLRLDDTDVPLFTIIDHTQRAQTPELTRYPKSGQTNPTVKLGIVNIADGSIGWADLSGFPKEMLISRVGWLPDSSRAYAYVQDRAQTWLDLSTVPVEGGKVTVLFRDNTKAWTQDMGPVRFLKDGSFVYFSERSGYKHLYHYAADGKLKNAVTSGDWDARSLQSIDETAGLVYFSGTKDGWLGSQAYKIKLDGTGLERVTKGQGTHEVSFSPDSAYFTDTFSTYYTTPRITLHCADGTLVRLIEEAAPNKAFEEFQQGKHEFIEIKAPDGFGLYATVLLPPNFDKNKKYPVWFKTYGGPHAPTIKNKSTSASAADQALAAQGIIVMHADPRSASGKGAVSAWTCYKQFGVQETKDIETCISWLLEKYPAADPKRIGMSGLSYGGYITAYCLTHTKLFSAGIAGAPVTDWHNYDSIYTERYMHLPKENPEGYKVSSVTAAAKNLHGRLLLIHGMIDDNVHVQNTVELMDALQKANKEFEVMLYPHARHGIGGAHYTKLQNDFMKRTMLPGK